MEKPVAVQRVPQNQNIKTRSMRIAVLSRGNLKLEMARKLKEKANSLQWTHTLDEFCKIRGADAYIDLDFNNEPERIKMLKGLLPNLVFVSSVSYTLGEIGEPFIRLNGWPGFLEGPVWELAFREKDMESSISAFFERSELSYRIVPDQPGLVGARILCAIINEAYFALEEGVSSREEIDLAMKLGTNYPYGPFQWCELIGVRSVFELLNRLSKDSFIYQSSEMLEKEAKMSYNGIDP
jgi:3-hydroxybutyryl-CoA dehydrogenase